MTKLFYAPGARSLGPHIVLNWTGDCPQVQALHDRLAVGEAVRRALAREAAG